jgi:hypothetical protein
MATITVPAGILADLFNPTCSTIVMKAGFKD